MTKHMKRLAAPRSLQIHRKEAKWTFRSSPGPHPVDRSIPLSVLVRDYLHLTQTGREAKRVIGAGEIVVDGRVRKKPTHPVGLMDVVTVPKLKKSYRVMMDRRGRLVPMPIKAADATWKFCRVEGKTTVPGGKTQVNLHDGRNLLLAKDEYSTGDVLKLSLPDQKVTGAHKFAKGNVAFVTGGAHSGELAPIEDVEVKRGPFPTLVLLKRSDKESFRTVKEYVFPVGEKAAEVEVPEVKILDE
jgi:small subunit ribosomal protein S4e